MCRHAYCIPWGRSDTHPPPLGRVGGVNPEGQRYGSTSVTECYLAIRTGDSRTREVKHWEFALNSTPILLAFDELTAFSALRPNEASPSPYLWRFAETILTEVVAPPGFLSDCCGSVYERSNQKDNGRDSRSSERGNRAG